MKRNDYIPDWYIGEQEKKIINPLRYEEYVRNNIEREQD